jgi:hypothetical protein
MSSGIARSIGVLFLFCLGVTVSPALATAALPTLASEGMSASLQAAAQKGLQGLQDLLSSEGLVGWAVPHGVWGDDPRGSV